MIPFFSRDLRIEWGQCDPAGIVFAPRFFDMFSENAVQMFEAAGLPAKRQLLEITGGAGIPLIDVEAKFLLPVRYGDSVRVETARPTIGNSSMKIPHRIMSGDQLCVTCTETRVWVADDGSGKFRPAPLPQMVRQALEAASGEQA